jgi:hypothetical protein
MGGLSAERGRQPRGVGRVFSAAKSPPDPCLWTTGHGLPWAIGVVP